jgi:rod shape-determining protein MreD
MAYLVGIPLLMFLAIFQSSVLSHVSMLEGRPDLILLAVVSWGVTGRSEEAMVLGLAGGIMLDLVSGTPVGSTGILIVIISFLVSLFEVRFWEAHFLMPLAVTLVASVLFHFMSLGIIWLMGRTIELQVAIARVILPSTFLNILLALPAAQAAQALRDNLFPPEVGI